MTTNRAYELGVRNDMVSCRSHADRSCGSWIISVRDGDRDIVLMQFPPSSLYDAVQWTADFDRLCD